MCSINFILIDSIFLTISFCMHLLFKYLSRYNVVIMQYRNNIESFFVYNRNVQRAFNKHEAFIRFLTILFSGFLSISRGEKDLCWRKILNPSVTACWDNAACAESRTRSDKDIQTQQRNIVNMFNRLSWKMFIYCHLSKLELFLMPYFITK